MAKEKKKRKLDKLIKGIIIGGAVGSVIGMNSSPKASETTKKILGSTTNVSKKIFGEAADTTKKASTVAVHKGTQMLKEFNSKRHDHDVSARSFFKGMRALLFGRKK